MYSSIFTNWIHLSNQHLKQESESVSTLETEKITLYHNFFWGAIAGSSCLWDFSSCGAEGPLSICRAHTSQWSDLPCCGAQVSGYMGFSSCSSRALEHKLNSCGLRCSKVCGIFVAQGFNLWLLHWKADSLHWTTRKPTSVVYTLVFWPWGMWDLPTF